jgi:hypothetical protein
MTTGKCTGFHPTHQAQLEYKWGGKYGNVNCQACSAGMAGQADTCGALLFTGAQIRAATNEPIPDPESPGLTLTQVHAAIYKLSNGKIDLDVHTGYPFASFKSRVIAGDQAILNGARRALIEAGQGYGNGFAKNHAIECGADYGVPWFDDPLTKRVATTWAVLERFAGTLDLGDGLLGIGKANCAFTRDITANYVVTVRPIKPAIVRRYTRHQVVDGVARMDLRQVRETEGFQLACGAPKSYPTNIGTRISLVQIHKAGSRMDGWWLSSGYSKEV